MKRVILLGSTGSIGTQAVEVARARDDIEIVALSAFRNGELLLDQARLLGVRDAALGDRGAADRFRPLFEGAGVELLAGREGVLELLDRVECDIVLNSIVGSAGLEPTLAALRGGRTLALANKESLVAGGELVMKKAGESGALIVPVDSEHSAVFQCLLGESPDDVARIVLTASGGPFRGRSAGSLAGVTASEALAHPTWNMGPKVTIDSATLMNKGLEVLEAHHLFGVPLQRIDVLVHPQSVVHSMVEMVDGSVLAHLGVPDMRIPIQYAMTYPRRAAGPAESLSLAGYGSLTFEEVDRKTFPALDLAYEAGRAGGTVPAAMNAANEEAVAAFLDGRITFADITGVILDAVEGHERLEVKSMEEIRVAESQARRLAGVAVAGRGRRA